MRLSVKTRFTHKNWAEKKLHWRLQFYLLKVNSSDSNSKDNKNGMKLEETGLHKKQP